MSATRLIDLVVPRLGETMERGVVRDWMKAVGDTFERGEAIVEIETDKTIAEVPAMLSGRLVEIRAGAGETLDVGAVLARLEVAASDAPRTDDEREDGGHREHAQQRKADRRAGAEQPKDSVTDASGATSDTLPERSGRPVERRDGPVRATPAARRVARAAGIDIRTLTGSGRRGRIESGDVRLGASRSARAAPAPAMPAVSVPPGPEHVSPAVQRLGEIAYVTTGPADGEPLLLLHGFAGDHGTWAALTQALVRAGRRVMAPDLPGHGATTLAASNAAQLSQGLEDVMALCVGARPCHLVAHSLGAAPAVALAERMPVASLSLLAPAGIGGTIDGDFLRSMASAASAGEVAHLLRRLSERGGSLSRAAIEARAAELSRGRLRRLAASIVGEAGQTLDLVPAIERLSRTTTVRVIVGHRDRIIDWRDACRLSPCVAVHHLPDAGHMPHWDRTRDVADILVGQSEEGMDR